MAAIDGSIDIISALLDHGADIEGRGIEGWTALHHAATNKKVEAMNLLLKRGANRHAISDKGHAVAILREPWSRGSC